MRTSILQMALQQIKMAFLLLALMTVLTGLIYPMVVTGIAQLLFPWQANGSMMIKNGEPVGSLLIGQPFSDPRYFWGRPSATSPFPYNAANSSGSNLGPSNSDYLAMVKDRIKRLQGDQLNVNKIPVDLVTASGSGLDPDISPLAAFYQTSRVAKARHVSEKEVNDLILSLQKKRTLGILGEPRVNVFELNLALEHNLIAGSNKRK